MADYLYLEYDRLPLEERYPESDTNGFDDWRVYTRYVVRLLAERETGSYDASIRPPLLKELEDLSGIGSSEAFPSRPTAELALLVLLARLRLPSTIVHQRCPRLFVSHRQPDILYALRVAWLAGCNGFDYWVDTLDPGLKLLTTYPLMPPSVLSLLTACIIEMALINCTHVVTCMTPKSRGSLWIPYEYGRITEIPGLYRRSCAWQHPQLAVADYPEYMYLGVTTKTELEIEAWLRSELPVPAIPGCGGTSHPVVAPIELDKIDEEEKRKFDAWLDAGMPLKGDITALPVFRFKTR